MPIIKLSQFISAPIEVCFDLSRSIELHMESTSHTNERAIKGRICGLIELGETVTWEATHFGIRQQLTSIITEFDPHHKFVDEMVSGAFKSFRHEHTFERQHGGTLMTDRFDYSSPFGLLGKLADAMFLRSYMERLLVQRNEYIKNKAECANQIRLR
ncbi:SRPBCC family protein [Paenibacillus montanisoli]|uniref:Cell division protein n=1 Tax=Paenibacillus montanisoli TaxID=2081970 RepID=A0A328UB40_9BACL|nr:SRPBCC family protein [Paenibacillus montanisoli]RAP77266.1 cell division protein [Paenibacillus montanisoli]